MPRPRMVSRTFKTTECTVTVAQKSTGTLKNIIVNVPREVIDPTKLARAVKKLITDEDLVFVEVSDFTTKEKLLAMSEEDFVQQAHEIKRQ